MRELSLTQKLLAFFLSFLLILPNSALALRPAGPDEPAGNVRVGLEEALHSRVAAGAEESGRLRWLPVAAVLLGVAVSTYTALRLFGPAGQPAPVPQPPPAKKAPLQPNGRIPVQPKGQEQVAGALAPLRKALGPDRQIGIIVWDPTDLVHKADLKEFFTDSVREGFDTVYISGYRFMGKLKHSQRQSLLDSASHAGVRRVTFIDGNDDWEINNKFPKGFYTELTAEADKLNWHRIEREYATDIEQYTNRRWKGDMAPRMDLVEQVILPLVNASKTGKGPLWEFHPWWLEPGRRLDSGITLQNLRFPKGTGIAAMSYGGLPEDIFRLSALTRRQALEHNLPFLLGVETIPGQGVPHFGGTKAKQIPQVLTDTVNLIRSRDPKAFALLGGVYVHTKGPNEGLRVVNGLGGPSEKAEEKPPQVKPSQVFGVKDGKAAVFTGQRVVLNLNLSKAELTGGKWVGVLFTKIKEDVSYIQPTADEGAASSVTLEDHPEGFNASVEWKAHPNRPFDAPAVENMKVVVMENSKFEGALQTYNLQANNPLTAAGAMPAFIRAAGKVRIIDLDRKGKAAIRSGGLEEVQITSLVGLLSEMDETFPVTVPAGVTHAFLLDKEAMDAKPASLEALTVDLYTHNSVSAGVLQVLPASWQLGSIRTISEEDPRQAAAEMEMASGAVNAGKNVLVALDSRRREGLTLPHALILLLDPATQDKLDRNVLAAFLGQKQVLLHFILDLTSGSVVTVRIEGREYYAILATAA